MKIAKILISAREQKLSATQSARRYDVTMPAFFFPLLWLQPELKADVIGDDAFRLHKRKWEVSIFDLYSLVAQKHPLRMPAELMHIFLSNVNCEIEVSARDFNDAKDRFDILRALMYLRMVTPTIAPFATNISLNHYAGINDRSAGLQHQMHEGLRKGITHKDARIETWPYELVFSRIFNSEPNADFKLGEGCFMYSLPDVSKWQDIERKHSVVRAARQALIKAPLMPDIRSSILHIWQGIESLFPSISTEITFRTSLLLAELLSNLSPRSETYDKARKSYGDRSKISHGSQKEATIEQWMRAWDLLRDALQAILVRRALPTEEELTSELLRGGGEPDYESMSPYD